MCQPISGHDTAEREGEAAGGAGYGEAAQGCALWKKSWRSGPARREGGTAGEKPWEKALAKQAKCNIFHNRRLEENEIKAKL
jgi:hypothetical protein